MTPGRQVAWVLSLSVWAMVALVALPIVILLQTRGAPAQAWQAAHSNPSIVGTWRSVKPSLTYTFAAEGAYTLKKGSSVVKGQYEYRPAASDGGLHPSYYPARVTFSRPGEEDGLSFVVSMGDYGRSLLFYETDRSPALELLNSQAKQLDAAAARMGRLEKEMWERLALLYLLCALPLGASVFATRCGICYANNAPWSQQCGSCYSGGVGTSLPVMLQGQPQLFRWVIMLPVWWLTGILFPIVAPFVKALELEGKRVYRPMPRPDPAVERLKNDPVYQQIRKDRVTDTVTSIAIVEAVKWFLRR